MEFYDLSKKAYDENGNLIPFSSPELVVLLGPDPLNRVGGFLVPSKDENHQHILIMDYRENTMKVYSRERADKDSPWKDWVFRGNIEYLYFRE